MDCEMCSGRGSRMGVCCTCPEGRKLAASMTCNACHKVICQCVPCEECGGTDAEHNPLCPMMVDMEGI